MEVRDFIREDREQLPFKAILTEECQNKSNDMKEIEDITPDSFHESKYLVVRRRDEISGQGNISLVICEKQGDYIVKKNEIDLQKSNSELLHYKSLKDIFNLKIHGKEKHIQMITMYTHGMLALEKNLNSSATGIKKVIFDFLHKGKNLLSICKE